ncbi:AHH domain-containing protein [Hyalangium versicolor]|uniref:AHH domain-containing protein n=1 Tax=Hyalangium versicolor TaxID=2861190 RepID=UPI001CCEABDB|nr:AHH domain-containing protein [Hyalangium versicolor]
MAARLFISFLLLTLLAACRTTRVVYLDTGEKTPHAHIPLSDASAPVEITGKELKHIIKQQAMRLKNSLNPERDARQLFGVTPRSGWYGYTQYQGVTPLETQPSPSQWAPSDVRITQEYVRRCEASGKQRDCLKLLLNNPVITEDGRYTLAMSFAMEEVLPEMMESFKDMADPEAIKASILWAMTIYAVLWIAPEPISKGLAAVVTAGFICYVGVDTFWTLIMGWRALIDAVDRATSFSEIREAGRKYGKVMGRNAARAFGLLLSAAIGQTVSSFSASIPTLPGSAQASVLGATQAGVRLANIAEVETVAVTADGITIALAPTAVAAVADGLRGAASSPVDAEGHEHHIATDKWTDAAHSGGPWTPKFEEIFDRAGMSLNDPANKVRVRGHQGPHPQAYHEEVYERLDRATSMCRPLQQCQQLLTAELKRLASEISTQGSRLNKLVTRTE